MNIRLKKQEKIKVNDAADLFGIMQRVLLRESKTDRNREHFWTVSLDNVNRILNIELVSLGTVNTTLVEPMEVLSIPLQKRAVKLVFVHNHPSGELAATEADKDLTDRLIQACRIMGVEVLDHLIISEKDYYSFAGSGLLAELEASLKYVPLYELRKRYEKVATETGRKKGEKERTKEIARTMKAKGIPVELIMEITGLSKATVVKLKITANKD